MSEVIGAPVFVCACVCVSASVHKLADLPPSSLREVGLVKLSSHGMPMQMGRGRQNKHTYTLMHIHEKKKKRREGRSDRWSSAPQDPVPTSSHRSTEPHCQAPQRCHRGRTLTPKLDHLPRL
ncbi:uncharacterized protein V6R79_019784 [Siganus canaliculatus]